MPGNTESGIIILGSMEPEIAAYRGRCPDGTWHGRNIHVIQTSVGKPAAAALTQKAIDEYHACAVIFAGVAGALRADFNQGDLCIGVAAIDADMDVRAMGFQRGEQPYTGKRVYLSDPRLVALAKEFVPAAKEVYIATGSEFVTVERKKYFDESVIPALGANIDGVLTFPTVYDMESSAVLQTADTNGIPALIMRVISDSFTGNALEEFDTFIHKAIAGYIPVVEYLVEHYFPENPKS